MSPDRAAVPTVVDTIRTLRLRYATACWRCQAELDAGQEAVWGRANKQASCLECHTNAFAVAPEPARNSPIQTIRPSAKPSTPAVRSQSERPASSAGASARREYDKRASKRENNIRRHHPHIGGLIVALSEPPQSTKAWAKGAEGERVLGASLDTLASDSTVVLHDRLIPGTKANIDHLVVTSTGIWVIDAKHYAGEIAMRNVGSWFTTDERLYVGKRDRTKLVRGMNRQVRAVRHAIGDDFAGVAIHPVLCFVKGEWTWFAKPFEIDGVTVIWPKPLRAKLSASGAYTSNEVQLLGDILLARLPAA